MTIPFQRLRNEAFLAQTERLDFRTSGSTKCKPPNRRCGNRCIPPNWDCRLRGEGNDPHLKAVGKGPDPIGGFANLERGLQKTGRSITQLSFSELDGARRSFARGVAKLSPGDLKQKEAVKDTMFNAFSWVGIPVFVGIFAGLTHTGLKANKGYRMGFGRKVDRAVNESIFNLRRNMPITGAGVRSRERAAQTRFRTLRQYGAGTAATTAQAIAARGPNTTFLETTARRAQGEFRRGETSGLLAVQASLRQADVAARRDNLSYSDWRMASAKVFWQTKLPAVMQGGLTGSKDTNLFAVSTTNNLMRGIYGIRDRSMGQNLKSDAAYVVSQMEGRLRSARTQILADMQQRNMSPTTDIDQYLQMNRRHWTSRHELVDNETHAMIKRLLQSTDTGSFAREQYKRTRDSFSSHFDYVADQATNPPGINNRAVNREGRMNSIYPNAHNAHSEHLVSLTQTINWPSNRPLNSNEMRELATRAYYTRIMSDRSTPTVYFPSNSRLVAIAKQLSGREGMMGTTEAKSILDSFLTSLGLGPAGVGARRRTDSSDAYATAFAATTERLDKRCGKSGIPDDRKCTKNTSPVAAATASPPRPTNRLMPAFGARPPKPEAPAAGAPAPSPPKPAAPAEQRRSPESGNNVVQSVLTSTAIAGASTLLLSFGANHRRLSAYRKRTAKSALESEKLSRQMEREFREAAARRKGTTPEKVTGYEASMYDYTDRGYDRGFREENTVNGRFGKQDKKPEWFGQTEMSDGAVMMLSYSDDGDVTRRGQGSFKMAKGGIWNHIVGNRDILPYNNNISQPDMKPIDDVQRRSRQKFIDKGKKLLGSKGEEWATTAYDLPRSFDRFKFLRKNVTERGYNPDAVRAAAFLVAQRRLTGKKIDILSYSNGGNVATETLAILGHMGYRDVKVINIAGPTFGLFKHTRDNMRTWVSTGDEFFQYSGGSAYTGGNTKVLKNSKDIPHGLMDRIDPNNPMAKGKADEYKAQRAAYQLNEELARDAYKYLHVNQVRAEELQREMIWRAFTKQPMEGDLKTLFGDKADATRDRFAKLLKDKKSANKNRAIIRDEIEERMLDVWYGGYDWGKAKSAAAGPRMAAKAEGQAQNKGPTDVSKQRAITAMLRLRNKDGTPRYPNRAAAEAAYKSMQDRKKQKKTDSYEQAFAETVKRLELALCKS